MQGYSKVTLIGNVGKDAEMRYTPDGEEVTGFSLAVSRKVAGNEETTWYDVTCWRGLAKLVNEYVRKGMPVYVEGRLRVRLYDAQDGTKKAGLNVVADHVVFLGRPKEETADQSDVQVYMQNGVQPDADEGLVSQEVWDSYPGPDDSKEMSHAITDATEQEAPVLEQETSDVTV